MFLLFGLFCSSMLITGAKLVSNLKFTFNRKVSPTPFSSQRKPNYLWWWLIYNALFMIITAGASIILFRIKDERYGLLSYFTNLLCQVVVTLFIAIYLLFVLLLLYFWMCIVSLYNELRKNNRTNARQITAESQVNIASTSNEDNKRRKRSSNSSSGSQVQVIPLNSILSAGGEMEGKANSKFFIVQMNDGAEK